MSTEQKGIRVEALASYLKTEKNPLDISGGNQLGQDQFRLLGKPQGHYTREHRSAGKLLIYFLHARGILVPLKWRDLIRDSSGGFLSYHFIFINA